MFGFSKERKGDVVCYPETRLLQINGVENQAEGL